MSRGDDQRVSMVFSEAALAEEGSSAVDQSIEIIRRRVDELGTREPAITARAPTVSCCRRRARAIPKS